MTVCSNCGEERPDQSRFCPSCGTQVLIAGEAVQRFQREGIAAGKFQHLRAEAIALWAWSTWRSMILWVVAAAWSGCSEADPGLVENKITARVGAAQRRGFSYSGSTSST